MRQLIVSFLCLMLFFFSNVVSAKIVFKSIRGDVKGIFVMNDDGSNVRLLTDKLKPGPANWSPDGKQIVFERWINPVDSKSHHIFLMNANGTNIRQLTEPHEGSDKHPSFSPDGKFILFTRFEITNNSRPVLSKTPWEIGQHSICVMDIEIGKIKKIADIGANNPVWSPDGKQIVFSNRAVLGKSGSNIWIMDANGHNPRELISPPPNRQANINRVYPKWSPDGKRILYVQNENKFAKIKGVGHFVPHAYRYFIYDLDKKQSHQLEIPKNWKCAGIDWMDNGKSVVVSADKIKLGKPLGRTKHRYNIYKYHIATGKITRLTKHSGQDFSLNWISDHVGDVAVVKAFNIANGGK
jgi:Tol biopolymer transport system component